jgi:aconitate hydratase
VATNTPGARTSSSGSSSGTDSFGARGTLQAGGAEHEIFRISAVDGADRLPFSLKVLLENLLRTEDGANVTADHVRALAGWDPTAEPDTEIQFTPARVIMQDFTGVPCVVDLATMREAVTELGGDPTKVNPLAPAELVIDHSVIIDVFGTPDAFERNVDFEYQRNRERYQFLRWGQGAFDEFKVVPPGTGIVHQVNLERLATVVFTRGGQAYPDTLVGTDSHTTMINGLGVLGWGVGGIEAEAAMLGQPVSMLIPKVVGFKLTGELPAGATATDLVLTVTELLRKQGVVGKFVEFYGPGVSNVPLADRATIGNMSPEYGSTCAIFPVDEETLTYLRLTGRPAETVALVEAYAKAQGLWHDPAAEPRYSERVELDLSDDRAVPGRSQAPPGPGAADRGQGDVPHRAGRLRSTTPVERDRKPGVPRPLVPPSRAPASTRPAPSPSRLGPGRPPGTRTPPTRRPGWTSRRPTAARATRSRPRLASGDAVTIDHGHVAIAAITSCTNTSNPYVMVGAGLLAKNRRRAGPDQQAVGQDHAWRPAPRSSPTTTSGPGLTPYLDKLGFQTVGYGCTTCIGNSGPLPEEVSAAVNEGDLAVVSCCPATATSRGGSTPTSR